MTKFTMRWLASGAILFALLLAGCSLFQSPDEPSPAPMNTPTATPTNMPPPEPATTPSPAPTATPTNTPTPEPTATPSPAPTATPTNTPTPEPTATPSPAPTATPTNTPTPEPPATPTTESAADRAALVALYEATDGPNWTNNTKWLSEAPLGEWYSVTTDSSGRVIELDLQGNQLSGEIPPELGSLIHLERLVLYGNELSGEIPPELGSLSNLEVLGLDGTQVSGCVPEGLGDTLIYNPLALRLPFCVTPIAVEDLPEDGKVLAVLYEATGGENWRQDWNWLSALPLERWHGVTTDSSGRVIELWLFENQLSGEIPPELGDLANLQLLILRQNQLSGGIPPELGRLSNLELLELYDNQLSGEIPLELGSLIHLERLSLSDNQLSGEIPPELGSLSNLESLSLSDNQLSGEIPPELGSLSNLDWLNLGFNQLSGGIPPELGSLFNLELLHLSDNQLSGGIPSELGSLANLQRLFLQRNQLSGCVPQGLSGIRETDLGTLGLPPCETRAAVAVENLPEGGAAMAALYEATGGANWKNNYNWLSGAPLGEWYGVTTDSIGRMIALDLSDNQLSGGIPPELGSLPNLQSLVLSGNQLSGEIPPELGSLPNLQGLHLHDNQLSGEDTVGTGKPLQPAMAEPLCEPVDRGASSETDQTDRAAVVSVLQQSRALRAC